MEWTSQGVRRRRPGFMLLELLLVVAIVGILAAVAMPHFSGMTDEAKVARIQADLSTIGSAAEMYYVKHGKYPTGVADLVAKEGKDGFLRTDPVPPAEGVSYAVNNKTGEVTCSFKGVTYSSFGKKAE